MPQTQTDEQQCDVLGFHTYLEPMLIHCIALNLSSNGLDQSNGIALHCILSNCIIVRRIARTAVAYQWSPNQISFKVDNICTVHAHLLPSSPWWGLGATTSAQPLLPPGDVCKPPHWKVDNIFKHNFSSPPGDVWVLASHTAMVLKNVINAENKMKSVFIVHQ